MFFIQDNPQKILSYQKNDNYLAVHEKPEHIAISHLPFRTDGFVHKNMYYFF